MDKVQKYNSFNTSLYAINFKLFPSNKTEVDIDLFMHYTVHGGLAINRDRR
jgi:hypothetical protein